MTTLTGVAIGVALTWATRWARRWYPVLREARRAYGPRRGTKVAWLFATGRAVEAGRTMGGAK